MVVVGFSKKQCSMGEREKASVLHISYHHVCFQHSGLLGKQGQSARKAVSSIGGRVECSAGGRRVCGGAAAAYSRLQGGKLPSSHHSLASTAQLTHSCC